MSAVGGGQVGERGGEDAGPVAHGAAAPMYELQFLNSHQTQCFINLLIRGTIGCHWRYLTELRGDEAMEKTTRMLRCGGRHWKRR